MTQAPGLENSPTGKNPFRGSGTEVETLKEQIKKLTGTIQEAEQERQAQQKELEGVIGERDVLGAQLIKRNEELALLYEKIKIQQSTLQKGESQFKDWDLSVFLIAL